MRTAIPTLGWVVAGLLFLYLCAQERHQRFLQAERDEVTDRLARLDPDPEHVGCQNTIERLSAELAKEARRVAAQLDYIDQLEHERAIDGGQTLASEAAQFLADQERRS